MNSRQAIIGGTYALGSPGKSKRSVYAIKRIGNQSELDAPQRLDHLSQPTNPQLRHEHEKSNESQHEQGKLHQSRGWLKWATILFSILCAYLFYSTNNKVPEDELINIERRYEKMGAILPETVINSINAVKEMTDELDQEMDIMPDYKDTEYQNLKLNYEMALDDIKILKRQVEEIREFTATPASLQNLDESAVLKTEIQVIKDGMKHFRDQMDVLSSTVESKDAQIIESQIADLKAKLEQVESRELPGTQSSQVITHQDRPKDEVNVACYQLGARIIYSDSTPNRSVREELLYDMGLLVNKLVGENRFSPIWQHKTKDLSVVLDEQPIRGSGDAYCTSGPSVTITVQLAYPVYIRHMEIEHAPREIERNPEFTPSFVKLNFIPGNSALSEFGQVPKPEFATDVVLSYQNSNVAVFKPDTGIQYQKIGRVKFGFSHDRKKGLSHICVYRIRVWGSLSFLGY